MSNDHTNTTSQTIATADLDDVLGGAGCCHPGAGCCKPGAACCPPGGTAGSQQPNQFAALFAAMAASRR